MTKTQEDLDPVLLLAREHVRNLDARVIKAERKSREEILLYGEHLLELRATVRNNDNAFSKELSSLGLHADKNVRSDAQKLAHAVASGTITRDDALLLPAREIRALPSPLKRRVSHVRNPKSKDQGQAGGEADKFAGSDDGSQVGGQNGEDPANDAEKLTDDIAEASDTGDLPDGEDVPANSVVASEGAEDADDGGGDGGVGSAADTTAPLNVCIPAHVATEILSLAARLLPERGDTKTADDYMRMAKDSPANASKHRRMADIVRLHELLMTTLSV